MPRPESRRKPNGKKLLLQAKSINETNVIEHKIEIGKTAEIGFNLSSGSPTLKSLVFGSAWNEAPSVLNSYAHLIQRLKDLIIFNGKFWRSLRIQRVMQRGNLIATYFRCDYLIGPIATNDFSLFTTVMYPRQILHLFGILLFYIA